MLVFNNVCLTCSSFIYCLLPTAYSLLLTAYCFLLPAFLFYNEENANHNDDDSYPAREWHRFVKDELGR